jgi:hypothetical protein
MLRTKGKVLILGTLSYMQFPSMGTRRCKMEH